MTTTEIIGLAVCATAFGASVLWAAWNYSRREWNLAFAGVALAFLNLAIIAAWAVGRV